jgi:hypothetical protein
MRSTEFSAVPAYNPTRQVIGETGQFTCRNWSALLAMNGQVGGNTHLLRLLRGGVGSRFQTLASCVSAAIARDPAD